jgi:hypothetical protein
VSFEGYGGQDAWEYHIVKGATPEELMLQFFGQRGWELVTVVPLFDRGADRYVAFFKRRRAP